MLTHSHSATSLYNLRQFKPISDQVTSIDVSPFSSTRQSIAVVDYQSQFELSWRSVPERCFSEGNLVDFQPFLSNLKG
jgi:hypothetical protein